MIVPGAVTDGVTNVFPVPWEVPPLALVNQFSVPPAHPDAFRVIGPVPQRSLNRATGGVLGVTTTITESGRPGQPFTVAKTT